VISDWRVDGNGVLAEGEYKRGSVLGKNGDGNYELTEDAAKAEAVLLDDVTVEAGAVKNAPIVMGGVVAEQDLVFGGSLSVEDVRESLLAKNIYVKKRG
jgi:hypothetical protein